MSSTNGLFEALLFPSIVQSSGDLLEELGQIMEKYCGEQEKNDFSEYCRNLEPEKANSLLNSLVLALSGKESVVSAIKNLIGKFYRADPELEEGYFLVKQSDAVIFTAKNSLKIIKEIEKSELSGWESVKESLFYKLHSFHDLIEIIKKLFQYDIPKIFSNQPVFSQKDRDFIELMCKIAEIYEKTELFLKNASPAAN